MPLKDPQAQMTLSLYSQLPVDRLQVLLRLRFDKLDIPALIVERTPICFEQIKA